ncbi:MAG TPA: hypothetical protein VFG41_06880 [Sphingomicrobium sp.]|jgi:hypothetical protein|nr:hypothetical protein [Sphingomicrobium sp.]
MLHLLPQAAPEPQPVAYAEAVSRLAGIRHALRLVGGLGDGPTPDLPDDDALAAAWPHAGEAKQHSFDRRSERLVGSAATGIEALLNEREAGREPNAEASRALIDEIRRELKDIAGIVLV